MVAAVPVVDPLPLTCVVITGRADPDALHRTRASITTNTNVHVTVAADADAFRRIVAACATDFLAVVREGEVVAPNAIEILLERLQGDPEINVVHAHWVPLGQDGRVSRLDHRAHRKALIGRRVSIHALPTFRVKTLRTLQALESETIDDIVRNAAIEAQSHGRVELISRSLSGRRVEDGSGAPRSRLSRSKNNPAFRAARKFYVRTIGRTTAYEMLISLARLIPIGSLRAQRAEAGSTAYRRIGYAISHYPTLSETFIRREVMAVRSAGIDLEVIAISPADPPMPEDPDSPGGSVHYYGPLDAQRGRAALRGFFVRHPLRVLQLWLFIVRRRDFRIRTFWRDRDLLFKSAQLAAAMNQLGVTHVHTPWAARYALNAFVASRLIGATFSVQARANEVNRRLERLCAFDRVSHASFIVANSEFIASSLRDIAIGRLLPPVHVSYNGLDLQRFVPPHRSKERSSPIRILSIGRLVEAKGFRYLLAACDKLRTNGHDFTCEIIGGSDFDDPITWIELRRMLDDLSLGDIVTFTGPATFSRVLSSLECADIFALPCVEGRDGTCDVTPNALLEAMAMGLPVVSTVTAAIPEIVDNGENGILVPPRDAGALTDAIENLLLSADLRQRLGSAARDKVERKFDSRLNASRLADLFERGMQSSASRAV